MIESNPYQRRNTVNGEINLKLNLKLISMLIKLSKNESLSDGDIKDIHMLSNDIRSSVQKKYKFEVDDVEMTIIGTCNKHK